MATLAEQQALYDELEAKYGREIADAFLAAIQDLKSQAEIERLVTAIAAQDIEGALAALHLDLPIYDDVLDEVRAAFIAGGRMGLAAMPTVDAFGDALRIGFNARNLVAERLLRERSSTMIAQITEDQREGVRAALLASFERGQNPRAAVVEIVGRYDPATRTRVGHHRP